MSEAQDGRNERPATGHGQPEAPNEAERASPPPAAEGEPYVNPRDVTYEDVLGIYGAVL